MHARASYQGWLLVVGFLAVAAITGLAYAKPNLLTHKSVEWTQIWSDNFTGPAGQGINTGDWRYQTGYGVFGNGEVEDMTRSPAMFTSTGMASSTSRRCARAARGRRVAFRPGKPLPLRRAVN